MFSMKKGLPAVSLLVLLTLAGSASAQTTRTFSLTQGDTHIPASPVVDASGSTTFYSALVIGQVVSATPTTFTFSLTFRDAGVLDPVAGIYSGVILPPTSSFSVSEIYGRKSVTTSGTVDSGTVTYRLTPDGRAEVVSVVSTALTVWQGKNKSRTAVGSGTVDYGTAAEGAGTMVLYL
jgi:hypothetical protein